MEDVRDSIGWVVNNGNQITEDTAVQADFENVFILGHLAGTIYTTTLLFHTTLLAPELRSHTRGIVLQGGIFRFPLELIGPLHPLLQLFDGDNEAAQANMPISLLEQAPDALLEGFPEVVIFMSEREPEGFAASNEELKGTLEKRLGRRIPLVVMKDHDHSPRIGRCGVEWGRMGRGGRRLGS